MGLASAVPFHFLARPAPGDPSAWWRMPFTHDIAMHFDNMRAFWRGLASGVAIPRWDEAANKGFGSPAPSYHPPAIYYLTSAAHLLVRDWGGTFLLAHVALMTASAAAFLAYARRWLSWRGALGAATAYSLAPYHLIDLYQRGAMAELLTFVWLPLAWLGVERLAGRAAASSVAGLAVVYALSLVSHPPTAYGLTISLGLLILSWGRGRTRAALPRLALALALGLGLAGFYLLPAWLERGLIQEDAFRGVWPYAESFLFSPRPPAEIPAPFWTLLHRTWWLGAVGGAVLIAALLRHRERPRAWLPWSAALAFFSLIAVKPLAWLSVFLPGVAMVSFPWRMLCVPALALALLVGAALDAGAAGDRLCGVAGGLVLAAGIVISGTLVVAPMLGARVFVPRAARPPANVFWMVPKGVPVEARLLPDAAPVTAEGASSVERWQPEMRRARVTLDRAQNVGLRAFVFPGWTAAVDGRPTPIAAGPWANVELPVPAGAHEIELRYGLTWPRQLGLGVSLLSVLVLLAVVTRPPRGLAGPAGRACLTPPGSTLTLSSSAESAGRSPRSVVGAGEESPDSKGQCAG